MWGVSCVKFTGWYFYVVFFVNYVRSGLCDFVGLFYLLYVV